MKLRKHMINWLEIEKNLVTGEDKGILLGPFMEYPKGEGKLSYVMQWHIRGRSVHTDWRMEVDDHLVGWTVLTPGGIPKPVFTFEEGKKLVIKHKFEFSTEEKNKGFRAETKARQPKVWLTVEGVMKAGEVGATREHEGVIVIIDKGEVYFGTQKPYFHEYFIRSEKENGAFSKDWTRVVIRAINVSVLDPITKKPKKGTELMWRVLVPGDQVPYAIDRGFKKKWVPPKGYIPVPPSWRKGDKYDEWEKWVKEAWAGKKETVEPIQTKEEKSISQEGLPFAGYEDFAECVRKNQDKAHPEAYCGAIKHKVEGSSNSFVVQYLTYMGQVVVRGIPNQTWFLRIREDGKIFSWIADSDFTRYSPVTLRYEGIVSEKKFDYEGDVPPNSEYNPSKTLTGKMTIVDKGSCALKRDSVSEAEYLAMQFHGKELKGRFVISQEEKGSSIYTIEKLSQELDAAKFVLQKHEIQTTQGLKSHFDIKLDLGFEFSLYIDPLTLQKEGDSSKAVYKACKDIQSWMKISEPKTKMMVGQLETYVTPIDKGKVIVIQNSLPSFISMEFYGEKLGGYFIYKEEEGQGRFERAKVPHPSSPPPSLENRHSPLSTNLIGEQTNKGVDEILSKIVEHELERKKETEEERKTSLELKKKKLELINKWLEAQKE